MERTGPSSEVAVLETPLQPIKLDEQSFVREHFDLPPMPGTLSGILALLETQTGAVTEVEQLIATDPAMTSHVLKLVNSAYYGLAARIGNLRHAIAYLGLGEISRIALALSVIKRFRASSAAALREFWLHSYLTALIGKRLARSLRAFDLDDLYTAALLHDVGVLVYQQFFPQHYEQMRRWCAEHGRRLCDAERHFQLPSHRLLGSLLCEHWHLPSTIRHACEFHELEDLKTVLDPEHARTFDVLIPTASVAATLSTDPLEQGLQEELSAELRRVLVIDEQRFVLLMADIYELKLKAEQAVESLL